MMIAALVVAIWSLPGVIIFALGMTVGRTLERRERFTKRELFDAFLVSVILAPIFLAYEGWDWIASRLKRRGGSDV